MLKCRVAIFVKIRQIFAPLDKYTLVKQAGGLLIFQPQYSLLDDFNNTCLMCALAMEFYGSLTFVREQMPVVQNNTRSNTSIKKGHPFKLGRTRSWQLLLCLVWLFSDSPSVWNCRMIREEHMLLVQVTIVHRFTKRLLRISVHSKPVFAFTSPSDRFCSKEWTSK